MNSPQKSSPIASSRVAPERGKKDDGRTYFLGAFSNVWSMKGRTSSKQKFQEPGGEGG